jgi:predicted RNA-binding Zn ribbon-like protein
MSVEHPVDRDGRVLPHCNWPSERSAPGALETVRGFCNTTNLESGADRLGTSEDFATWLSEQGHHPFRATKTELARCVAVRESLRDAATAHRTGEPDISTLSRIHHLVGDIDFRLAATAGGFELTVDPEHDPADRFTGTLALVVMDARADGTWARLKTCRRCRWVVYDHSKNQSSQWCSMSACGGRSKVQAHRTRVRAAAKPTK